MALDARITMSLVAHETSSGDLSKTLRVTPAAAATSLTDGVVWSASRTLASSSETLNLAALADTREGSPATVTFTSIKAVFIKNAGTANLTFTGGPFAAGGEVLRPAATSLRCDASPAALASSGVTVTGSVGGTYDVVFIGGGSVS